MVEGGGEMEASSGGGGGVGGAIDAVDSLAVLPAPALAAGCRVSVCCTMW